MTLSTPYHLYPPTPDMADAEHAEHGPRVYLPHPECVLCQQGLCVQFELAADDGIVLHGRWLDG